MSITGDILPDSTPVIRFARDADASRILELVGRLGHAVPVDPEAFRQNFPLVLNDHPRTLVHVADVAGSIAGYALTTVNHLLYANGPSAQLQEIVVDDTVQTRGVGTALVRAVEAACEESGVTQLTVASRRAGGFYDRLGYTQQAEYMRRLF